MLIWGQFGQANPQSQIALEKLVLIDIVEFHRVICLHLHCALTAHIRSSSIASFASDGPLSGSKARLNMNKPPSKAPARLTIAAHSCMKEGWMWRIAWGSTPEWYCLQISKETEIWIVMRKTEARSRFDDWPPLRFISFIHIFLN